MGLISWSIAVVAFIGFAGILRLVAGVVDWRLLPTIRRVRREVGDVARRRYPDAGVMTFGATDIDPRNLAVIITTKTDEQRDRLRKETDLYLELRDALSRAGYPEAAVPLVRFDIESQETVNRDFGGSWFYAMK